MIIPTDVNANATVEGKQQMTRELTQKKSEMEVEGCTFTPDVCIYFARKASHIDYVLCIVQLSNNDKVYNGAKPKTNLTQTFSRLATPKHKIPKSGGESTSKRSVLKKSPVSKKKGGKTAGKVSFIDRVKQKAKKAANKPEQVTNKPSTGWACSGLYSGQS